MSYILTINAGSSSLKCALFSLMQLNIEVIYRIKVININSEPILSIRDNQNKIITQENLQIDNNVEKHLHALDSIFNELPKNIINHIKIIGHRVVHGGDTYKEPTEINMNALHTLEKLTPLAPLHLPFNIALIKAIQKRYPTLTQLACFDTSFHQTQPDIARDYALPTELTQKGIRSYGFHGLSYEYITQYLYQHYPKATREKIIIAHLGSGSSMCAVKDGQSIATTMGFTPLDGLPMGTRCGHLDPGIIIHLIRQGMSIEEIETLLYKKSGWLGVSGISNNMKTLLDSDDSKAHYAIDHFIYRATCEIGGLSAAMGGLDGLVFTGGVGENSSIIRAKTVNHCNWLGATLNNQANKDNEIQIQGKDSHINIWAIPTDEEKMLAQHCANYLANH